MSLFYLTFTFLIISNIILKKCPNGRKYFCILSCGIYFLIAALRGRVVGYDTDIYVKSFERLADQKFLAAMFYSDKDYVFWGFLALIGKVTTNYTILFIIVNGFFCFSVWHFIYKYSYDPCLSVIVLLSFNLFQFSITGMRQTIAMGCIVWAIDYLYKRKLLITIICILIASLFHQSALICLIFIPIFFYHNKLGYKQATAAVVFLVATFSFKNKIAQSLNFLIKSRKYEIAISDGGLTMTFVVFMVFLLGCLFIKEYTSEDNNSKSKVTFLIAICACFFEMLVSTQSIFFRVAFYFLVVYIIYVPNVVYSIRNRNSRSLVKISIYLLLSLQYLFFTVGSCGIYPYITFWQM